MARLFLPPFVVQKDQFAGRMPLGIEEVGDQDADVPVTDPLRVVEGASTPCGPAAGRSKAAALAAESGTSRVVPSRAINRKPP